MEFKNIPKGKIYLKIIRFFHDYPTSIDTPRGVATWTNEDIEKVRPALKKLAESGLLIAHKVSSTVAYTYTRDKKIMAEIEKLLEV